jgi:outer membrane biosynthesis protein TonB
MKTASRTLVKSPPEVWEQLDHPGRMQGLMSALVGHAAEVTVYEREEESKLAWRASDDAWIEVELAEKGWGTNVSVTAENGTEATKLEGWLDAVIDELATPTKRPFEGMGEATEAETPRPEPVPEPEPIPEPEPEPMPEPVPEPEQPQPVAAAVEEPPPAPEPKKKKKRFGFLGF